ncbi:MAG: hypothetical protein OXG39_05045 [Chloroflexi bacterium]|nr:hypothetical protein [Chloroflexota bacterium]
MASQHSSPAPGKASAAASPRLWRVFPDGDIALSRHQVDCVDEFGVNSYDQEHVSAP